MSEIAKLLAITPFPEKHILHVARVSSDQTNEDPGRIRFLLLHGHWSPFEHSYATIQFETSRAIGRQMLRHRSFTFQEFSQRYADGGAETIKYQGRSQAEKDRQSSVDDLDPMTQELFEELQRDVEQYCAMKFNIARNMGVARECARFLLTEAARSPLIMTGNIRSWIHYFAQRCDEHTQLEHRVLALAARDILKPYLPTVAEVLDW